MNVAARLAVIEGLLARGSDRNERNFQLVALRAGGQTADVFEPAERAGRAELDALVVGLGSRFGEPRTVALDGFLDPSFRIRKDPGLADVLAGRVVDMYGWNISERWIGVGLVRDDSGAVGLTAATCILPVPAAVESARAAGRTVETWAEKLVAVTGRPAMRRSIDWDVVEDRLGLPLPRDYKLLAELFGVGTFDDNVELCVPHPQVPGLDLDLDDADSPEFAAAATVDGAPARLLRWGMTSAGHSFCWLVEDPDPDTWPILVRRDKWDPWYRFDHSVAEHVYLMLTDPDHPDSLADHFETHWFTSSEPSAAEEDFRDEYHPHR